MAKKTLTDIKAALHKSNLQLRGLRDQGRTLEQRLASKPDWNDLTPEAKRRRIEEARASLRTAAAELYDEAQAMAGEVLGSAERSNAARYRREAKFSDDPTLEELTRIRLALELPRIPNATLGAMASDAQARGGDAAAALLTLIRREVDSRTNADGFDAVDMDTKAALIRAETDFPLPAALVAEQDALAEIGRTVDGIASAHTELALPPGLHVDTTDNVERWKAGDFTVSEMPTPHKLPFTIVHNDKPQPNDAA